MDKNMKKTYVIVGLVICNALNGIEDFSTSFIECHKDTGIELFGKRKTLVQHLINAKKDPEIYQKALVIYGPKFSDGTSPIRKYTLNEVNAMTVKVDTFWLQKIKSDRYKIFITSSKDFISQYYLNKLYAVTNNNNS